MQVPTRIIDNPNHGRMMTILQREGAAMIPTLKAQNQIIPCVVVNFNPVRLKLPQALINWTVPREGHYQAPDEAPPKTLAYQFDGKKYLPSYIVLKDAVLDKKPEPVRIENGEPKTQYHPVAILPVEQAYQYWDSYNRSNQNDMGGVLMFQGTGIEPMIQKKDDAVLRVPVRIPIDGGGYAYGFEERPVRSEIERVLNKQKTYYEQTYQTATRLHQDPSRQFGTPNEMHRIWAQWGLDMGFRENAPDWMERAVEEGAKKCPSCKRSAIDPGAHFCICGVPFDAYEAYMAGLEVATVHLINLPEDKLKKVKTEIARRKKVEAELGV